MNIKKILGLKRKKNNEVIIESKEIEPVSLEREYFFGDYKILLKDYHVLDKYQSDFPLYDQFLPFFCKNFEGLIIDIGANIGDTTLSILSKNNKSFIICVEPDFDFFNDCLTNISNNNLNDRILGVNKFLTTKKGNFYIKKDKATSTGFIFEDEEQDSKRNNTITFEKLMSLIPVEKKNKFDILKIDTDSFDWDVIQSFIEYTKKTSDIIPRFIFFEMQTFLNNDEKIDQGRNEIIDNYKKALLELQKIGYTNFCLFDNFGTYFKKTKSIKEIIELALYIKRSQLYNSHTTIYYFDILTYHDDEINFVDKNINKIYE